MATQLLDTSSGSGGGEPFTINNEQLIAEQEHERLVNLVEDPLDKYDKKKFTKEDRKVIVNNIVTAFESQKTKETKKLKELEVKVTKNEANESEKKEYKTKSKLKEVVKPQKVRNISEQISVVQSDIKKVFPLSERKGNTENKVTAIPLEYKLSQNYPNPFNPTTKINYEIKNAGFVTLKIYDLLGREIVQLVNETKDAGRYSIDFNASKYMLASGIYFYRIKAGEFIDTKRMVLVK
ncbi:MAG: T9SS type A sorting domain-containing protein [Ignavibacteria bacterium]|nr:T9SS type A sorting domain-containing protein [Ignavibacteria bacterium]